MASQEQNEAVAGLLRQSLAHDAAAQKCPDAELLAAYFEHSLAEEETSRFDLHLSKCSRCRAQLAAMVRAELPGPPAKTFWLFDWRLLSATALVLVIATVWFLRRPTELAPVAENVSPRVAAPGPASGADASTVPNPAVNVEPRAANDAAKASEAERLKKSAAPQHLVVPPANVTAPAGARVLMPDASAPSKSGEADLGATRGASPGVVQTESADVASAQPAGAAGAGQGGGFATKQVAPPGGPASPSQQISQSSQMVLVQPSPPPRPATTNAASKTARAEAKDSSTPSGGVVSGREPVDVSSTVQSEAVTSAQKPTEVESAQRPTDKIINTYATNEAALQTQILDERSREKVIDTPIPAVKWRITSAGFVERSEDGGTTWTGQEPDPEAHLIAGSAPTAKVCWLVGKEGVVLVTKDAANWKKIPPPASADITSVSAKSASVATVTTSDGRRFTTHNEGKKWKPVN